MDILLARSRTWKKKNYNYLICWRGRDIKDITIQCNENLVIGVLDHHGFNLQAFKHGSSLSSNFSQTHLSFARRTKVWFKMFSTDLINQLNQLLQFWVAWYHSAKNSGSRSSNWNKSATGHFIQHDTFRNIQTPLQREQARQTSLSNMKELVKISTPNNLHQIGSFSIRESMFLIQFKSFQWLNTRNFKM